MKATQLLHNLGQSIWLDNITRDLLNSGTLKRYVTELSVTGLTSNPTIFDHAIKNSSTIGRSGNCISDQERYVGTSGHVIGMKTLGASAPLKELQRKFGFKPDRIVAAAKEVLGRA